MRLPDSLVAANDPTAEKVEMYRAMTPEERVRVTASVCRAAAAQLALHSDPARILDLQSPLPESTLTALRRLRHG